MGWGAIAKKIVSDKIEEEVGDKKNGTPEEQQAEAEHQDELKQDDYKESKLIDAVGEAYKAKKAVRKKKTEFKGEFDNPLQEKVDALKQDSLNIALPKISGAIENKTDDFMKSLDSELDSFFA